MNIIKSAKVVSALVLLIICLSNHHSLIPDIHLYAQNMTQPSVFSLNNSRNIITHTLTPSVSEIVSPNSTVLLSFSNYPYSIVEPSVSSSDAILANYTASAEYLSSESFTSIDASISRSAEILDGSSLRPLNTVVVNESNSSVIGTNVK